jgi:hypothetical protein
MGVTQRGQEPRLREIAAKSLTVSDFSPWCGAESPPGHAICRADGEKHSSGAREGFGGAERRCGVLGGRAAWREWMPTLGPIRRGPSR